AAALASVTDIASGYSTISGPQSAPISQDAATALHLWTITVPMVLPFLMLAVLFRGIENFKMFDLVVQLTGGGPGNTTTLTSIDLKREAFEKWRTGYSSAYAIILFVTVFGLASIYVKALNKVKER
ncbi:MAG: hypothetical protein AAGF51_10100, partial [Pseudomonadota bacterium]